MDLIIDTSSENLQVILNGKTLETSQNTNTKHLQHLLPEIDLVLKKQNSSLKDVNTFAVVLGPGSFTGVRIGVSTIKAFSNVFPATKIVGINMFELLAFVVCRSLKPATDFAIVIKSTATKYYFAVSSNNGNLKQQKLLTTIELENFISENKIPVFAYNLEQILPNVITTKVSLFHQDYINFVENKKNNKEYVTENNLKPIYLALSQAEEELLKRQTKND